MFGSTSEETSRRQPSRGSPGNSTSTSPRSPENNNNNNSSSSSVPKLKIPTQEKSDDVNEGMSPISQKGSNVSVKESSMHKRITFFNFEGKEETVEYTPLEIEGAEDVAEKLVSPKVEGKQQNVSIKRKRRKSPDILAAEQLFEVWKVHHNYTFLGSKDIIELEKHRMKEMGKFSPAAIINSIAQDEERRSMGIVDVDEKKNYLVRALTPRSASLPGSSLYSSAGNSPSSSTSSSPSSSPKSGSPTNDSPIRKGSLIAKPLPPPPANRMSRTVSLMSPQKSSSDLSLESPSSNQEEPIKKKPPPPPPTHRASLVRSGSPLDVSSPTSASPVSSAPFDQFENQQSEEPKQQATTTDESTKTNVQEQNPADIKTSTPPHTPSSPPQQNPSSSIPASPASPSSSSSSSSAALISSEKIQDEAKTEEKPTPTTAASVIVMEERKERSSVAHRRHDSKKRESLLLSGSRTRDDYQLSHFQPEFYELIEQEIKEAETKPKSPTAPVQKDDPSSSSSSAGSSGSSASTTSGVADPASATPEQQQKPEESVVAEKEKPLQVDTKPEEENIIEIKEEKKTPVKPLIPKISFANLNRPIEQPPPEAQPSPPTSASSTTTTTSTASSTNNSKHPSQNSQQQQTPRGSYINQTPRGINARGVVVASSKNAGSTQSAAPITIFPTLRATGIDLRTGSWTPPSARGQNQNSAASIAAGIEASKAAATAASSSAASTPAEDEKNLSLVERRKRMLGINH